MWADFPATQSTGQGARPLLAFLETRLPGSRWDLVEQRPGEPPRFLLGRANPGNERHDAVQTHVEVAAAFVVQVAGGTAVPFWQPSVFCRCTKA